VTLLLLVMAGKSSVVKNVDARFSKSAEGIYMSAARTIRFKWGTFRSIKTGKLLRQRRGNKDKVVERVLCLLGCAGDTGHTVQIKVGG
jgi:hypothetical protein